MQYNSYFHSDAPSRSALVRQQFLQFLSVPIGNCRLDVRSGPDKRFDEFSIETRLAVLTARHPETNRTFPERQKPHLANQHVPRCYRPAEINAHMYERDAGIVIDIHRVPVVADGMFPPGVNGLEGKTGDPPGIGDTGGVTVGPTNTNLMLKWRSGAFHSQ